MANITNTKFNSFIGVDLHKDTVSLEAVNPAQRTLERLKISTKAVNKIDAWLAALPRPTHMAVEACPFNEWFIDRYRQSVDRIDIADATALANQRGKRRRNDRNDAREVAKRLARGDCPLGFIADDELMQLRKLGRHWRQLSRTLSRSKHCMKSMLLAANLRGPKFDAASAQRWYLANGQLLKGCQRRAFGNWIDIIALIERQREPLRRAIISANRSKRIAETTNRLKTPASLKSGPASSPPRSDPLTGSPMPTPWSSGPE